jgi:hypothetical protein
MICARTLGASRTGQTSRSGYDPGPQHTLETPGHVPAFILGRQTCGVRRADRHRPAACRQSAPLLRLERLPQLIPGGYRGIRRGRLEWIQVVGIPGQPRGPA